MAAPPHRNIHKKQVTIITGKENVNYELYAKWTVAKYVVNYDGNGNTGKTTKASTFTYDAKSSFAANKFVKTGYTFVEWNSVADGTGTSYKPGVKDIYNLSDSNAPVTVYAIWKPINYKVTFVSPNKTQKSVSINATYDSEVSLLSNPFTPIPGYRFAHWNTKSNGKGTSYSENASVKNLAEKANKEVKLYPIFELDPNWTYQILYDANGGKGTMEPTVAKYNETTSLKECTFEKVGYWSMIWTTKQNGKTKGFATVKLFNKIKNLFNSDGSYVTLKAVWLPISYKITYNPNTGDEKYDKKKQTTQKCTYDKNFTVPKCKATRNGYTFEGWEFEDGVLLPGDTSINKTTVADGIVEARAVWKKNGSSEVDKDIKSVEFSSDTFTIKPGDTLDLKNNAGLTVKPDGAKYSSITWKSSDTKVATVDKNGVVKGVKDGTATITVTVTYSISKKTVKKDITLVVKNFSYFSQDDPEWNDRSKAWVIKMHDYNMNVKGENEEDAWPKFSRQGCYLTCVTMLVNNMGYQVSPKDMYIYNNYNTKIDPWQLLCDNFSANQTGTLHHGARQDVDDMADLKSKVREKLNTNPQGVILVVYDNNGGAHYLLATGFDNDGDIIVNDPKSNPGITDYKYEQVKLQNTCSYSANHLRVNAIETWYIE